MPSQRKREDFWRQAVVAMAFVLCVSAEEVETLAESNGDLVIQSKDAEVVIALVEGWLDDGPLVDGSNLGSTQLTSLGTLTDLLWTTWREKGGSA